ncbi:coat protein [Chickpea yellows virus]|uniref:Capsid protein n=1 Tax=Chickpea yellows virus TaxID=1162557 RepID=H9BAI5_9GEMI|nr:coat protein [Chickpea yellows virus]AFD63064.1 coat protein [Chickpea yellows virus]
MNTSWGRKRTRTGWNKGKASNQKQGANNRRTAPPPVPRRDSLQVATFSWTSTGAGIKFSPGGSVYLINTYPQGANDNCRHTNSTLTYKLMTKNTVFLDANFWPYVCKIPVVFWLVYDKSPGASVPNTGDIFDGTSIFKNNPSVWTVSRAVCHRFVVKKTWTVILEANGVDPTKKVSASYYGPGPCNQWKSSNKFFKRLGVSTEWKNSASGDVADIKEGALYIVCAPSQGFDIYVNGYFRVYFKSVGNQ